MSTSFYLNHLWKKGTEFLGVPYAILGGAMTWVSEHRLVSSISNAGGFGILASGSMPPELLREEIRKTQAATQKPFGVNLIVLHPQLEGLAAVCVEESVSHVVLAGGLPPKKIIEQLHQGGCKVIGFAPSLILAKKVVRLGVDAFIIEGTEAGGHIGPISTSVLAQEILPHIQDVPIFVAGGIGRGDTVLSYLEMGAAGCQLGTRFVCAAESIAHDQFKQAFIHAQSRDATISQQLDPRFPVIPVRALANQGTRCFMEIQQQVLNRFNQGELTQKEAQLEIEHFWAGALRRAVMDGDVEHGSVMAGQSVGMVTQVEPAADIIQKLLQEIFVALEKRGEYACEPQPSSQQQIC
ncbi:MAG: NAD(P)H-dependent flavin oxidoreductase [Alphaproteobacteria bacterium]